MLDDRSVEPVEALDAGVYAEALAKLDALNRSQAIIEFDLDGHILSANDNFLVAMGYRLDEIVGKHHAMFVDPSERASAAYKAFWDGLRKGEFRAEEFKRIAKDGSEVWIQASYNPICDLEGKPYKVVKFASDVTAQVHSRQRAEHICKLMENTAAGSEQLNASVFEIAESMKVSQQVANDAFAQVSRADAATQDLDVAAKSMGSILDAINKITSQINMLALNATIEAARAGDAGKGFAVVANEVKSLATQTQKATRQIGDEIGNMLKVSAEVVDTLSSIKSRIDVVREKVDVTTTAIEDQKSITSAMNRSMRDAAEEASAMGQSEGRAA